MIYVLQFLLNKFLRIIIFIKFQVFCGLFLFVFPDQKILISFLLMSKSLLFSSVNGVEGELLHTSVTRNLIEGGLDVVLHILFEDVHISKWILYLSGCLPI